MNAKAEINENEKSNKKDENIKEIEINWNNDTPCGNCNPLNCACNRERIAELYDL